MNTSEVIELLTVLILKNIKTPVITGEHVKILGYIKGTEDMLTFWGTSRAHGGHDKFWGTSRPRGGYINKFRGVERLFKGYREKIGTEGALTHTSSQGGIHVSHAPEVK